MGRTGGRLVALFFEGLRRAGAERVGCTVPSAAMMVLPHQTFLRCNADGPIGASRHTPRKITLCELLT